jgi:hypothetical protein
VQAEALSLIARLSSQIAFVREVLIRDFHEYSHQKYLALVKDIQYVDSTISEKIVKNLYHR